jgi:hypothetical protein
MAGERNRKRAVAAALSILLVGGPVLQACAKKHLYPGERRPDSQIAYIEAERFIFANTEFSIDGREAGNLSQYYIPPGVSGSWFVGSPTIGASVLPGNRRISAHVARMGYISAAQEACAALTFRAEAGQRYKLFVESGKLVIRNVTTGQVGAQTPFADCMPQAEIPKNNRS